MKGQSTTEYETASLMIQSNLANIVDLFRKFYPNLDPAGHIWSQEPHGWELQEVALRLRCRLIARKRESFLWQLWMSPVPQKIRVLHAGVATADKRTADAWV